MIDQLEPAEWHWWTGDAFGWMTDAPEERLKEGTMDQYQWEPERDVHAPHLREWHLYPRSGETNSGLCRGCVYENPNGTWNARVPMRGGGTFTTEVLAKAFVENDVNGIPNEVINIPRVGDSENEITAAIVRYTMQQYEGYRLMGEPPAFALREAIKKRTAMMEQAAKAADNEALRANYRDVEEVIAKVQGEGR